ncbi:DUF3853 family protein (plasmid) [Chryseobacterium sp. JJR-5R]|uniref:DUF3853 family protein n=1 Tax=Chryseobacterium sp. JJR-5R TaxID=3093923 RepID=UPI002A748181|nr:DUF3853 family protein [Chryseobacterium sp. JJR-5R]WPO84627.1 DUF3853 family protein [Chryseobacterium sp. JJR-5R]
MDLEKKISDLTVAEYLNIQSLAIKKYEYGIIGIAKIFGVSRNTAQKIKNSGVIDDAVYQNKNTIVIDISKAIELFAQKPRE